MGDLTLHDDAASDPVRDAAVRSLVEHLVHRRFLGEYDDRGLAGGAAEALVAPLDDRLPPEPALARSNEEYVEAPTLAGESGEQARRIAEQQVAELLPDGLDTAQHHFFVGQIEGQSVGTPWIGTERPMAFVYDVVVDEARRREGHGAALMRAGALLTRDHGSHALGLNVFGCSRAAKTLYDRLGYTVVEEFATRAL